MFNRLFSVRAYSHAEGLASEWISGVLARRGDIDNAVICNRPNVSAILNVYNEINRPLPRKN